MSKCFWLVLLAQAEPPPVEGLDPYWTSLWHGFIGSLVFGLVGIILIVVGIKFFDLMNTKLDFQQELGEKQNVAVAIVMAAMILGVAIIAAVAVR